VNWARAKLFRRSLDLFTSINNSGRWFASANNIADINGLRVSVVSL
jgi:hypothetical protein